MMKDASTRIFLFVTCLAFSSPLMAEDWMSLFQRLEANMSTPLGGTKDETVGKEYEVVVRRLATEDAASAQTEIAQIANIYDQNSGLRRSIGFVLQMAAYGRMGGGGIITGPLDLTRLQVFQPFVPTAIAHLFDGDPVSTAAPMGLFMYMAMDQQNPPNDILRSMIDLSRIETEPSGALGIVAIFCGTSKQAVLALSDAMAANQPFEKRYAAFEAMDHSSGPTCTDPELVDAVSTALKSEIPPEPKESMVEVQVPHKDPNEHHFVGVDKDHNIVAAGAKAAGRLLPRLTPAAVATLEPDLQRIAADTGHPATAKAASEALGQLQR